MTFESKVVSRWFNPGTLTGAIFSVQIIRRNELIAG